MSNPDLTVDERVERGVQALNRIEPDWLGRIDLNTLNLGDMKCCILAQVFGCFYSGQVALTSDEERTLPPMGFNIDHSSAHANSFSALQDAWERRLQQELKRAGSGHVILPDAED